MFSTSALVIKEKKLKHYFLLSHVVYGRANELYFQLLWDSCVSFPPPAFVTEELKVN